MFSIKKCLSVILSLAVLGATAISSPAAAKADSEKTKDIGVSYAVYVETSGLQDAVKNGETAGTVGMGKRLEAIRINLIGSDVPEGAKIIYKTHVQTYGWQEPVSNGQTAGTFGKGKRLEAVKITLSGLPGYAVQYRGYVQTYGWQDWATTQNGTDIDDAALCGTTNVGLRLEAIEIKIIKRADTSMTRGVGVSYVAHIQTFGWQDAVKNGETAGTVGMGKRLEAIRINLTGPDVPQGAKIIYKAHVQTYGWQEPVSNGQIAGTFGEGKRLEAIKITLSGLPGYEVQYRGYVQAYGWQDWVTTQNGTDIDGAALCGTTNVGLRLEAVEIKIVKRVQTWIDGRYEVGKDIPAGRYILYPRNSDCPGYFKLTRDTSGTIGSIIASDSFTGREIIDVEDGQFLTIERGVMYAEADAPAADGGK